MKKVYEYAHDIIQSYIEDSDILIDFTMGNGNDTVYLCECVPNGKVVAFDIQEKALRNTRERLENGGFNNFELILDGHENVHRYIDYFKAGIFNLGYLPSGDRAITTKVKTTKKALMKALDLLSVKGVLVIVVYQGHNEGKQESKMLLEYVKEIDDHDFDVAKFSIENKENAPYLLIIEKNRPIIS